MDLRACRRDRKIKNDTHRSSPNARGFGPLSVKFTDRKCEPAPGCRHRWLENRSGRYCCQLGEIRRTIAPNIGESIERFAQTVERVMPSNVRLPMYPRDFREGGAIENARK